MNSDRYTRKLELSHKFTEQFELAEATLEASDDITIELNRLEMDTDSMTAYQASLVAAFFKCSDCLRSTLLLAGNGFTEDGRTIVRKMIELYINLKYLGDDVHARIDRYLWHEAIWKYLTAKRYIDEPRYSAELHDGFTAAMPKISAEYDSAKKFFKLDKFGEVASRFRLNWSGKTLPKMAIAAEVADLYARYDLFSISVHSSVKDVNTYYDSDRNCFDWAVNTEDVPYLVMLAIEMQMGVSLLLCNELAGDPKGKLAALQAKWKNLNAAMSEAAV